MALLGYVVYQGLKVVSIYVIYQFLSYFIKQIRFAIHYMKFPYEPGHWLLGDLLKAAPSFPKTDRQVIADAVSQYVDRNHLRAEKRHDLSVVWMSWYPIVIASSHRSLEAIFKGDTKKHHIFHFLGLRDGIVCSNGAKWKSRRKMIEPMFTSKQLSQFVPVIRKIVDTTIDSLESVTEKPITLSHYIHSMTMDAIFESGFKIGPDGFKEEKKSFIEAIGLFEDRLMLRIINPLYWNDWMFSKFKIGKQLAELSKKGDDYFNYFLDMRFNIKSGQKYERVILNNTESEDIFVDHPYRDMIDLMEKHKDQIDRGGMIEEMLTIISAGHETTATSMSWLIFALGNHPEIQDKMLEEIDRVIESTADLDDLNKINQLVYMDQCIKEALRLYTPTPVLARTVENDIQIGDKTILKGSAVVCFLLSAHYDPEIFPEPFRFDPERFAPGAIDSIPKYGFVPFGSAPRMCIGYRYAYIEMKIFLCQFIRRFRVKSLKTMDQVDFDIELITRPKCPLEVVLTSRD